MSDDKFNFPGGNGGRSISLWITIGTAGYESICRLFKEDQTESSQEEMYILATWYLLQRIMLLATDGHLAVSWKCSLDKMDGCVPPGSRQLVECFTAPLLRYASGKNLVMAPKPMRECQVACGTLTLLS